MSAPSDDQRDTVPAPRPPEGCNDDEHGDDHATMLPPAPTPQWSELFPF